MKRRITRTTILLMISLLFVMLPLSSCGGSKKVSLEKYAEIVFREPTYNGYATPRLEVDTDTLDASVPEETMRKFHKKVSLALLGSGNKLSDIIYFDFAEDYKNLKNGDTIEVVVKPEADLELCGITTLEQLGKELGVRFSSEKWSFRVKGLPDPSMQTVDLQALLRVDFGKYNGYATPSISLDGDALAELINGDVYRANLASVTSKEADLLNTYDYASLFQVAFSQAYNKVSNGDVLLATVSPSKDLAALGYTMTDLEEKLLIHFTSYEASYTVSGLEEAKDVIDLFGRIEDYVHFRGPNGKATATLALSEDYSFSASDVYFNYIKYYFDDLALEIVYDNKSYGNVYYKLFPEKDQQLKEGDVVTVKASFDTTFFEENGFVIASDTYDIVVPDLGEYLTAEDVESEETVNRLETHMLKAAEPWIEDAYDVIACHGLYFGTINPGVKNEYDAKTVMVGVVETHDGWWGTQYELVYLYDVVVAPDHIFSRSKSDSSQKTIEKAINRLSSDYTFVKIK